MNESELNKYIEVLSHAFGDIVVADLNRRTLRWGKQTYSKFGLDVMEGGGDFPDCIFEWINNVVGEEDRDHMRSYYRKLIREVQEGRYGNSYVTEFRINVPGQGDMYFGLVSWGVEPGFLFLCCTNITKDRFSLQRMEERLEKEQQRTEELSQDNAEICYEQESFSVTGTIVTNPSNNNKYMVLAKEGDQYTAFCSQAWQAWGWC